MDAVIVFCASYLFILVIILQLVAVLWLNKDASSKVRFVLAIIVAGIIAFILSRIAGKLFYDPRPFVTEHVKPLIPHAPDNGFPSDHALLTGTLTAITYFFYKKYANWMLILTIIIGVARVLAKVHSPLDIAGGWVFGIIGAFAGFYIVKWILTTSWGKSLQASLVRLAQATPLLKKVV